MPHHHHLSGFWAVPALVVLVTYVVLAGRTAWSRWRTASFAGGCALVTVALTDPVAALAATDFRGHVLQHLLIGVPAPLALALGAPVTLLLRSLPAARAGRLALALRGPAVHLLANPWTALALSAGGLAALYCTPLYGLVPAPPVHAYLLLAGYLFAWVVAGPDPAPRRPPAPVRLAVVGVAIAVHAGLSAAMYAGWLGLPVPSGQLRGAAEIVFPGGGAAELLLAVALAASRRARRAPEDADVELLAPGLTVRVPGEPEPVRRIRVPDREPARTTRGPLTPSEYGDEDEPDPADL
ncbi:cytochrome c oxidase assembly protein [Nonomuraea sp. NPDC049624]|uniref:cytochrome c oxidase assembly protein n=2 Tax=unclassified Nonomuraea TaxID=2593643 RepID=UPI003414A9AC